MTSNPQLTPDINHIDSIKPDWLRCQKYNLGRVIVIGHKIIMKLNIDNQNTKHRLFMVMAFLVMFIATTTPTHANNFYGTQSLKPMVEESETTIYLPGGTKLTTEANETEYLLTNRLHPLRQHSS